MAEQKSLTKLEEESAREVNNMFQQIRLEESKQRIDAKIDASLTKYIDVCTKYDQEHPIARMTAAMLNILVPLQEFTDLILNMEDMMSMLNETLVLMDNALLMIDDFFTPETQKYSVFRSIKQYFKRRRYWSQWKRRIQHVQSVFRNITGASAQFGKTLDKMSASFAPKKKTKKGQTPAGALSPQVQMLLDKKLADSRADGTGGATGAPDFAPAPSGGGSSTGAPGVDDLI
ncbi:MAG: hypothetical protein LBS99_05135 [Clostridiales bacterium]|jgi:hypothetical protein|nr:hypothetical protein [Clostridiales bacterium]